MSCAKNMNDLAITKLLSGDVLAAQTLLRQNAKKTPSCISLNNLGAYYIQYGMILSTGRIQCAKKKGMSNLLKATLYGSDWRNDVNIATALIELENNIPQAYRLFAKAYAHNPNNQLLYNMGACLFRLGALEQAFAIFKSLCTDDVDCTIVKNGGQSPYLVAAYCLEGLHNVAECINYINTYRSIEAESDRWDIFHLRCLCGLYQDALSEYKKLLDEWYPTDFILAFIAESITHVPALADNICNYFSSDNKHLLRDFLGNPVFRKQKMNSYSYVPPFISIYQFIV